MGVSNYMKHAVAVLQLPFSFIAMFTLRRGRIVIIAAFIIVAIFILVRKSDLLVTSETLVEYVPPLRPPETVTIKTATTDSEKAIATDHAQIIAAESEPDIERLEQPSKPTESNEKVVDPSPAIGQFTVIPEGAHRPGFTLLDNLYLRNGTFYVITSHESQFPSVPDMISSPRELAENVDTTPTSKQMQFLSTDDVESVLGKHAIRIEGLSVIVYDPPQFMTHLYHWWGEIILGAWRVLSFESGKTKEVPIPKRFLLPFSAEGGFRDPAGVDALLMRAAWPSAQIEESDWWQDLITLGATVVFDRVMLINRPAAHRHHLSGQWNKMIAGTMDVNVPDNFWEPLRKAIVTNLLGHLPTPAPAGDRNMVNGEQEPLPKPLVTYVSRQRANSRRLRVTDHEALLSAFAELEKQGVCEFREARMEDMSLREQVELAARSTIIIGIHGNGLTHQLWMPPSYRSAVYEIFDPEGYMYDYAVLAGNMEHRHYAVWNDRFVTYPKGVYHDSIKSGEHFHGSECVHSANIPVDAKALADAVKEHLTGQSPESEGESS